MASDADPGWNEEANDFFTETVIHGGKSGNIRNGSDTATRFQSAGAPFIAGVSGSVALSVLMIAETTPKIGFQSKSVKEQEDFLLVTMALLVTQGHHSFSEGLLAAKTYGYFKDIPDPIESTTSYRKAIAMLQCKVEEFVEPDEED